MRHTRRLLLSAAILTLGVSAFAQTNQTKLPTITVAPCPPVKPMVPVWARANEGVTITVDFISANSLCFAAPVDITVRNKQKVTLVLKYMEDMKPCTPTITVATAPPNSSVGDVIQLLAKAGTYGIVEEQHPEAPKPVSQEYDLPDLSNKVLTASTTCKSDQNSLKSTRVVKITYQNPPRVGVSAGVVIAPGVKSYGFKTAQTGVGAGGVVTTQNSIAVTGSPSVQFIPFSFVNLYWAGSRTLNLNGQLGIGVNPNLSSVKVEFFASPLAISWHDIYFSPGFHIGQHERLVGGFTPGELTASSLNKVPIAFGYYTGFGFSLSYNLKPLVKSGSSATPPPASSGDKGDE